MAKGIAAIHVKQRQGHPTVIVKGKTPREQSFIKELRPLACTSLASKNFKKELAEQIAILLS